MRARHIQVSTGLNIQFASGMDARLFCRRSGIISFRSSASVNCGCWKNASFGGDGDAY